MEEDDVDLFLDKEEDEMNIPTNNHKRHLGVLRLVAIGFFWTSGGIYGNEELVKVVSYCLFFSENKYFENN